MDSATTTCWTSHTCKVAAGVEMGSVIFRALHEIHETHKVEMTWIPHGDCALSNDRTCNVRRIYNTLWGASQTVRRGHKVDVTTFACDETFQLATFAPPLPSYS